MLGVSGTLGPPFIVPSGQKTSRGTNIVLSCNNKLVATAACKAGARGLLKGQKPRQAPRCTFTPARGAPGHTTPAKVLPVPDACAQSGGAQPLPPKLTPGARNIVARPVVLSATQLSWKGVRNASNNLFAVITVLATSCCSYHCLGWYTLGNTFDFWLPRAKTLRGKQYRVR